MDRRTFLKAAGLGSISFAYGCNSSDDKKLYSLVRAPDDMVTGDALWYASTCLECPAGCGVIAKNREGRVVKLEGNPLHPVNRGKLCIRGQSALQAVYDPDRLKTPLVKTRGGFVPISYEEAFKQLTERAKQASNSGKDRVKMVSGVLGGPLSFVVNNVLGSLKSSPSLIYEPFSYDALRGAHQAWFSKPTLPSIKMENSDFILGFGADFLETWLSPVEYACKFKAMHSAHHGHKGFFAHVGSQMSLTAANADCFFTVRPGSEYAVALGILRLLLEKQASDHLLAGFKEEIRLLTQDHGPDAVEKRSGLKSSDLQKLVNRLMTCEHPLVLGSGSLPHGDQSLALEMAVVLINFMLDKELSLYDFDHCHRVETAATAIETADYFDRAVSKGTDLLLLYNTNPIFTLPFVPSVAELMTSSNVFKVSFSSSMDETTEKSDLVIPVKLPVETWDIYESKSGILSSCQPAMGQLTDAPSLGEIFLKMSILGKQFADYPSYLTYRLYPGPQKEQQLAWNRLIQQGGRFEDKEKSNAKRVSFNEGAIETLKKTVAHTRSQETLAISEIRKGDRNSGGITLTAVPSLRYFDGRGANRSWLSEIPDPVTSIAWETMVMFHPDTLADRGLNQGDRVRLTAGSKTIEALVYSYSGVHPDTAVMAMGQGHTAYGRYASGFGSNPLELMHADSDTGDKFFRYSTVLTSVEKTGQTEVLPKTDGSRSQYHRKIALSMVESHGGTGHDKDHHAKEGLTMDTFPLTLPIAEGYDKKRDVYKPHTHEGYRWGMAVDLDRCIGCSACVAACYAENNVAVVGREQIIKGREMAWLRIERYQDQMHEERLIFLPMMCQQCDNAPCESVCPVYAPHHSKEGLNNQIYNRCIGTRFCAQNCPYKVRRFNWLDWEWPSPLNVQLNPNVTVRSKGVMEKCSFCVQRIKEAHGRAKNRKGTIQDGEIQPACVQTCPTNALVFGNFLDKESRLYSIVQDQRAYQVLGYLNTKPAVIYLKKVLQEL